MIMKLLLLISIVATLLGAVAPLMTRSADEARIKQVKQHLLSAEMQHKTARYRAALR